MRLLLVFHLLPYPPDDGGRIGFFNPIKYLSRKHEISAVCLTDRYDQEASVEELRRFCVEVRTYKRPAWQDKYRLLRGAVFSPPGSASKYWHPAFGELIRDMIRKRQPEVVEFHHLNTAMYRRYAGDRPTILREHNVEYKVWERFGGAAKGIGERIYGRWLLPRVRRFEAHVTGRFDRCVVVTPADAEHLREIAPQARIEAIASGVDTEYFYPSPQTIVEPFSITITGSFSWKPKQQSLSILLSDVFPRIRARQKNARLYIVGKGIPDSLWRIAERTPGVTVTGPVADVRPYVWRSSLVINYLQSGGGIALKVLEAMVMRKPVLTNALGCEGLEVTPGKDIVVADGPERFAEAAAQLLVDESWRTRLSERAYETAMKLYSWQAISDKFQRCYEVIVSEDREKKRVLGFMTTNTVESPATQAPDLNPS